MRWMEFIKVQTTKSNIAAMLQGFVAECRKCHGLMEARVLNHAKVGDCSLCLFWNTERPDSQGSSIGLHLSGILRKYGLVDHSVWLETEDGEEKIL